MELMYQNLITAEEMKNLPVYAYEGQVKVVEEVKEIESAVRYLHMQGCLGFDTETRPAFKKGEYHPVSLLQLAAEGGVYLFRLNKCGFPTSLRALLADEKIVKIGVGIRDDLRLLQKINDFFPASFVELQSFVEKYGIQEKSFSKMMAIIFRVRISKKQRVSNWEASELTAAQIKYAATDAWGALQMYKELNRK